MSKGIGRLFSLGIKKEGTRGTAEASASFWIPFSEMSIEEKDIKAVDEQSFGVIEDSVGQSIVKQWAEGTVKAPIGDKHFPLVLMAALGALSSGAHAGETIVYDHTITLAQSAQHQALTLFLDDPLAAQDYKHALGVISGLEIRYELGKFLEYTANFKAKKGATATLTPSMTAENRFLPQHLTVKLASALSGLDAATGMSIKSLSLKIEKNIEDDDVLGNVGPADFLNKQFTIEGQLEAVWQNESDFKTAALAATAKAMRFDLANTGVTLGNAANPQVRIDLAKVIFKEITRPIRLNDVVKQTLSFKAHYSSGDSKMITILAVNGQASY